MKKVLKFLLLPLLVLAGIAVLPGGIFLVVDTLPAVYKVWQLRDSESVTVQQKSADGWSVVSVIHDKGVIRDIVEDILLGGPPGEGRDKPDSACPFWLQLGFNHHGQTKTVSLGTDDCRQYHSRDLRVAGTFRKRDTGSLKVLVEGARPSFAEPK